VSAILGSALLPFYPSRCAARSHLNVADPHGPSRSISRVRSLRENSAKVKPIAQPSRNSAGISVRLAHFW
jgi:hypothetical protein